MKVKVIFEADKYKGHPLSEALDREEAKEFVRRQMEVWREEYDSFEEFEEDCGSIEESLSEVDEFFDIYEKYIDDEEFRKGTLADPKTEWVTDSGDFLGSVVFED